MSTDAAGPDGTNGGTSESLNGRSVWFLLHLPLLTPSLARACYSALPTKSQLSLDISCASGIGPGERWESINSNELQYCAILIRL